MPMHDWSNVEAGIFHDFHHAWIFEIKRALNHGTLPEGFYALAEQVAAGFGPDVLTLQDLNASPDRDSGGTATLTRPKTKHYAQLPSGLRPRRKSRIAVRHISDDRIVAMLEIVSPGNKDSTHSFRAFVHKACEMLDHGVHLLLLDPFPPGPRDPEGIHAAIWGEYGGENFRLPAGQPLTMVAYEASFDKRAYTETLAVGDVLPEMPLFLAEDFFVQVPLEATYMAAWSSVPTRWQTVIERKTL